jgi:hypothetical protein
MEREVMDMYIRKCMYVCTYTHPPMEPVTYVLWRMKEVGKEGQSQGFGLGKLRKWGCHWKEAPVFRKRELNSGQVDFKVSARSGKKRGLQWELRESGLVPGCPHPFPTQ